MSGGSGAGGGGGSSKRKQYLAKHAASQASSNNPKRGGPGVLLTCEAGREKKCRVEGLDILNHYVRDKSNDDQKQQEITDDVKQDATNSEKLSLADEIKELNNKTKKHMFSIYDTGVRGTVVLLCTLPGYEMIPPCQHEQAKISSATSAPLEGENDDSDDQSVKEPKMKKLKAVSTEESRNSNRDEKQIKDEESQPHVEGIESPPWDPVSTVHQVMEDLRKGSASAPSSRFVTRMIPIQATCYASEEELVHTARHLFARYSSRSDNNNNDNNSKDDKAATTFAIHVKRRISDKWKTLEVIEMVAKVSPPYWKVDLTNPKYTLWIEICKTLCCMSIIENAKDYGNFNLVETREKGEHGQQDHDDT